MASAKIGRPTVFTPDTKDLILEYIEAGMPNHEACRMVGVDPSNLYLTISRDPEFRERYERAKAGAVDALVAEGEQAAERAPAAENGAQVAGLKVLADYKFRMASRLAPQRWGEKSSMVVTGSVSEDPQELAKRLAFLQRMQNGPGSDAEPDEDDGEPLV